MTDKERLILTSIIGAQLGPLLDKLAVPPADQAAVVAWFVAGIPVAYHLVATYGPRLLARWWPALFKALTTAPANAPHFSQPTPAEPAKE